jgi:hypothetical protein
MIIQLLAAGTLCTGSVRSGDRRPVADSSYVGRVGPPPTCVTPPFNVSSASLSVFPEAIMYRTVFS